MLDGLLAFSRSYQGELATETMLVRGVNEELYHLLALAHFLARLQPATAYLAIPTRPPAEDRVQAPPEENITRAYQLYCGWLDRVEYLIGYEGNAFAFTGNVEEDLLSIMAVHPMREDAVGGFLQRAGANWTVIDELLAQHQLIATTYEGERFYMRKLHRDRGERMLVEGVDINGATKPIQIQDRRSPCSALTSPR